MTRAEIIKSLAERNPGNKKRIKAHAYIDIRLDFLIIQLKSSLVPISVKSKGEWIYSWNATKLIWETESAISKEKRIIAAVLNGALTH